MKQFSDRMTSVTIALVIVTGCAPKTTVMDGNASIKIPAETVAMRKEIPTASKTDIQAVHDATNQFGLSVLREAIQAKPGSNLVISPLSLAQDFTLLHECAKGATKDQVAALLGVKTLSSDALKAFHVSILNDVDSDSYQTLKMANGIWIKQHYPTDPVFARELDAWFGCSVELMPEDSAQAKSLMDKWVSEKTHNMIKEIKTEITPEVFAMFLNALYFDGKWVTEFDPKKTMLRTFVTPTGNVQTSMMLGQDIPGRSHQDSAMSCVELPFLGDRFSFVIAMPSDPSGFKSTVSQLNAKWFSHLYDQMARDKASIVFPKLDLSTYLKLNDIIKKLGAEALFQPGLDVSALAPTQGAHKGECQVSSVIQQAKLKLDEKGVKAAAVSEVGVTKTAARMPLEFNRPFFYFVIHIPSNTIVLCGVVNDPSKTPSH